MQTRLVSGMLCSGVKPLISFAYEIRDRQLTGPALDRSRPFRHSCKADKTVPIAPQGEAAIKGTVRSLPQTKGPTVNIERGR